MKEAWIVSGARTPTGVFGGMLSNFNAPELGAIAVKEALRRANVSGDEVGEVIVGTHFQAGIKANSARQAAIYAGLPIEVPAWTPNKNCGTGLKAVNLACQMVMLGEEQIIVGGGCETMSRIPYLVHKHRFGVRMGHQEFLDGMLYDGLIDPFKNYHMGVTAENVAAKCGITRQMQDEWALRSHNLAEAAEKKGNFKNEIVPVEVKTKKGTVIFDKDETIRHGLTMADLEKLKPVFKKDGTVTPGNASGLNDEGAAVVVMDKETALKRGLKPMLVFRGCASVGVDPSIMGYAPVPAIKKLIKKTGIKLSDVDRFEINEAFASQCYASVLELGLDEDKVNVNGGAIALGHPVGCTGTRLTITMANELERIGGRYGIVALCIGGGQGIAALFERIEKE